MKKVLITAYDVDPYKGSESATGWNYPINISKDHNVTLITRKNNLPNIERYIHENCLDVSNISFIGLDLPRWAMFWKKGKRGSFLYYYLWQFYVSIKMLAKKHEFDLCHALNFHCNWAPTFLWLLNKPLVWGPINHNEPLPAYMLDGLGFKSRLQERIKFCFKSFFWNFDPFLFMAKIRANKILVGHEKVIERLSLNESKCVLFNQVATDCCGLEYSKHENDCFTVLFVGRGLLIKNYWTVINSFLDAFSTSDKKLGNYKLIMAGVGGLEKQSIDEKLSNISGNIQIEIISWLDFKDMPELYKKSDVFCFPSFEGAGMVIAEALSYSLPVITIDRNGAYHELTDEFSFVIQSDDKKLMIENISERLRLLESNDCIRNKMSEEAFNAAIKRFDWSVKSKRISNIYSEI